MTHPTTATWQISIDDETTTASWDAPATGDRGVVFVCAHGAGGNMNDGAVLAMCKVLRDRGVGTVRFDFLYRALKKGRPDPMPRLVRCLQGIVDRVRAELDPRRLILGGRSMGGRAASVFVADGASCDGLLLLAYPLHPPEQPEKLRVAHLPAITVPVLCMNGTRDPFCTPELMAQTLAALGPNWRMHWLEHADHSFHVLKRTGRNNAEVLDEAAGTIVDWLDTIP
jgi:predicted alpha/beta-hydrolase family hydrolase